MHSTKLATRPTEAVAVRLKDVGFWADWAALVGLVALVLVFEIANPTFLSSGNVKSMLVAAAILIILSVGQTFVIATAGIDLSIASTMTLGAVVFGRPTPRAGGWHLRESSPSSPGCRRPRQRPARRQGQDH